MCEVNKQGIRLQPRRGIRCPHCGWEYDPSELLFPDNVLGQAKPESIVRDPLGKILYLEYQEGKEPLAEETYYCDNCGREFVIEVDPRYTSKAQVEELDFSETSVKLF